MRVAISVPTHLYKWRYPAPMSMPDFPTGHAYIAAALKKAGHEVIGFNANNDFRHASAQEMLFKTLSRGLQEHRPDVLLLGGICTDYACIKESIGIARKFSPGIPIVLGGGIATHDAEFIHGHLRPDITIPGEAEDTIVDLLGKPLQGGIYSAATPDIHTLPYPDYDLFGAKEIIDNFSAAAYYLYKFPFPAKPRPFVIVTGRSCPYRCTFCVHGIPAPYRTRGIADVMREIKAMHDRYEFNVLVLLDELFTPNSKRLREFSREMLVQRERHGWNFKWCFQTHCSAGFTADDLREAKAAGLYYFSYGMETASPTVIASMAKKSSPKKILAGITASREANVGFGGNFIFGDPAETPTTLAETFRYFKAHGEGLHIHLGGIQPYPGSKLYYDLAEKGADFYERIDERRFRLSKHFPEKPWTVWVSLVGHLGGRGLWHKSAERLGGAGNCPYCATDVHAPARLESVGHAFAVAQTKTMSYVLRFKRGMLFLLLLWVGVQSACLLYPWYRWLASAIRINNCYLEVTGCPKCNRAILVKRERRTRSSLRK